MMGTSVTSTGITFPDATTQTTAATSAFAAGTVVLFFQAAAPTGWTKAATYDDYALRLTTGTGGTVGGTTAFSTVFANQTPTITTSGLSAGATTLTTTQMPSHQHTTYASYQDGFGGSVAGIRSGCGSNPVGFALYNPTSYQVYATGGGGSHTHTVSGSATSSAITLNVRYANIIACSKN